MYSVKKFLLPKISHKIRVKIIEKKVNFIVFRIFNMFIISSFKKLFYLIKKIEVMFCYFYGLKSTKRYYTYKLIEYQYMIMIKNIEKIKIKLYNKRSKEIRIK